MPIPENLKKGVQFTVSLLAVDCYSPMSYLGGIAPYDESDDGRYRWQLAVDVLYRFVMCGLVEVPWERNGGNYDEKVHGPLFHVLRTKDPNGPFYVEWHDELCPTEFCKQIIDKYDLTENAGTPDYEVCEPFIEELEALFERHGVPWSDEPLLPVQDLGRS